MLEVIRSLARKNLWRLDLREEPTPHLIEAAIDLGDWTLTITIDPKVEEKLSVRGIKGDDLTVLAEGLVHHEMGHWEVCPFDSEGQYLLIEPIGQVVRKVRGTWNEKKTKACINLLANMVADVVVDTVLSLEDKGSKYADAQALFFLKGLNTTQLRSPVYDMFIRLNLELWGKKSKITEQVASRLSKTTDPVTLEKATALFRTLRSLKNRPEDLASRLRNRYVWSELAEELARVFLSLMPTTRPIPVWWRPSPFRKVLAVLYEGRVGMVRMALPGDSGCLNTYPIAPLICQPMDSRRAPELEQLVWAETRCLPSRTRKPKLQLWHADVNLEVPLQPVHGQGFLPDLAFWVDSSASMEYEPFSGRGEYDLLLRTVFGVFKWLKDQGVAAYLNYAALNFSGLTLYSGWRDWNGREALYRTLFHYQGGSTRLNLNQAKRLIGESRRPFVVFMITDGEVDNVQSVLQFIQNHFTPPKGFVLVQVGRTTELARGLQSQGFTVHVLKDHSELKDLVVGEVGRRYAL